MQARTGTVWRIRRTRTSVGFSAPRPREIPLYALMYYVPLAALLVALVALVVWLLVR